MNETPRPPEPPKIDPEFLVLRAQPRRVVRFKRNLVIGLAQPAVPAYSPRPGQHFRLQDFGSPRMAPSYTASTASRRQTG